MQQRLRVDMRRQADLRVENDPRDAHDVVLNDRGFRAGLRRSSTRRLPPRKDLGVDLEYAADAATMLMESGLLVTQNALH